MQSGRSDMNPAPGERQLPEGLSPRRGDSPEPGTLVGSPCFEYANARGCRQPDTSTASETAQLPDCASGRSPYPNFPDVAVCENTGPSPSSFRYCRISSTNRRDREKHISATFCPSGSPGPVARPGLFSSSSTGAGYRESVLSAGNCFDRSKDTDHG